MISGDDEWVKAAMNDDTMVVELLVRLNHASLTPSSNLKPAAFPIEWTVRQRRSKPVSVTNTSKKQAPRASPTTPLSWSGATSYSGGCGGGGCGATSLEESSRPSKPSTSARSKANCDGEKSSSKLSRKKKTLVELKEEENLLVKERRELKRDIVSLRQKLEKQRATNESLKRAKTKLQLPNDRGTTSVAKGIISVQLQQKKTAFDSVPAMVAPFLDGDTILQCSTLKQKEMAAFNLKFLVPDLNIPFEEERNLGVACEDSWNQ
ncbi:uncharacterized protein LOC142542420 [Primulina tabacum]|uniref:uncharacterized protein LOC142542420 n=1 Tax=Primulina tabacum TaxID=48773 RepID=UPI003F59B1FE